jgi:ABC-type transport system involved in cytochrome c biogenesis permease subunit
MFLKVHLICFAASYAIALTLELSRLLFRSGIRAVVMYGFVGAGWVAHTAYLYHRAVRIQGSPLSSYFDWLLLAAWVLVLAYLYMAVFHPKRNFGVFLLPLALGLIAAAALAASRTPFDLGPASKVWGVIHGTSILLATVAILIGFAAGMMFLGQAWWLKKKRPPLSGLKLPSLEWLQHVNARAFVVSLVMLTVGVVSGVVLNLINYRHGVPMLPWTDPLVLGTLAMFGWILLHTVILFVYRPLRRGRKVAYLTLVSFLFLVLALTIGLMVKTQHGRRREGPAPAGARLQIENCKLQIANCDGTAAGRYPARSVCRWKRRHTECAGYMAICNSSPSTQPSSGVSS